MSIFKTVRHPSLFVLLMMISGACFSGGVSERKHEARTHISTNGVETYQLSLDEVLPGSKSIFIAPSSDKLESKLEPILIRVTGYSAFEAESDAKSESKRLLTLRASKLDAYRSLAERVYGLSISGKSMVKDFVLKEDRFAVGLDSYIRGARVVSVNEKKGVGFETVLELILPGNFNDCLNKVNNFKNGFLPSCVPGIALPDSLSQYFNCIQSLPEYFSVGCEGVRPWLDKTFSSYDATLEKVVNKLTQEEKHEFLTILSILIPSFNLLRTIYSDLPSDKNFIFD